MDCHGHSGHLDRHPDLYEYVYADLHVHAYGDFDLHAYMRRFLDAGMLEPINDYLRRNRMGIGCRNRDYWPLCDSFCAVLSD